MYQAELYVLAFMSRQQKPYLAQLRCYILPLQLELGRRDNKAMKGRKYHV